MIKVHFQGIDSKDFSSESLGLLATGFVNYRDVRQVTITDDDVYLAWQQYLSALPWPRGAAFYAPDVAKPGHFKPTRIVWFGDDARFALANWRHT